MAILLYFGWSIINFDNYAQSYTQQYLNTQLKSKNLTKLKAVCADRHTYHFLRHQKTVTVKFTTDNQGSGDLGYYAAKINSSKYYFVDLKIKAVIPNHVKLTGIRYDKN